MWPNLMRGFGMVSELALVSLESRPMIEYSLDCVALWQFQLHQGVE